MKKITTILFLSFYLITHGQSIKEMTPTLGYLVDKSLQGEIEFIKNQEECENIWKKVSNQADYDKLSTSDKKKYDNCDETYENYWDVIGVGCSWYCGGGADSNSATSHLKSYKGIDYSANNIHDLNYKTAWIEGVPGYGIGESITYHFPPENPRITEIIIVNGYIKTEQIWKDNSRVKKLKMYVDNHPFAILHLADSRQEQHFKIAPLGNANRGNWEELSKKPSWIITFEILDVYKGDKYDDTAITEIYFDGIDVH